MDWRAYAVAITALLFLLDGKANAVSLAAVDPSPLATIADPEASVEIPAGSTDEVLFWCNITFHHSHPAANTLEFHGSTIKWFYNGDTPAYLFQSSPRRMLKSPFLGTDYASLGPISIEFGASTVPIGLKAMTHGTRVYQSGMYHCEVTTSDGNVAKSAASNVTIYDNSATECSRKQDILMKQLLNIKPFNLLEQTVGNILQSYVKRTESADSSICKKLDQVDTSLTEATSECGTPDPMDPSSWAFGQISKFVRDTASKVRTLLCEPGCRLLDSLKCLDNFNFSSLCTTDFQERMQCMICDLQQQGCPGNSWHYDYLAGLKYNMAEECKPLYSTCVVGGTHVDCISSTYRSPLSVFIAGLKGDIGDFCGKDFRRMLTCLHEEIDNIDTVSNNGSLAPCPDYTQSLIKEFYNFAVPICNRGDKSVGCLQDILNRTREDDKACAANANKKDLLYIDPCVDQITEATTIPVESTTSSSPKKQTNFIVFLLFMLLISIL